MVQQDDFLTALYDSLYDTPRQRHFRTIRPIPVGVVFVQWPGMSWDDIREHLRLMKRLGYTCLKGHMLLPGFDERQFMHMALDEGIIPWWYGEGGWEPITDALLDRLGIPRDTPIEALRENPAFLAHQEQVFRARIDHPQEQHKAKDAYEPDEKRRYAFSVYHELITSQVRIPPEGVEQFTAWLKRKYGTLEALKAAWNVGHAGIDGAHWTTWEEAVATVQEGHKSRDCNRHKDVLRFKTEVFLSQVKARLDIQIEHDPQEPVRAGGEISVFFPVAGRGIDMEGIAELLADHGSLYPSTHLAWHFDKVGYEITRPVYMYSALMADAFKGGWTATWESTGGPQQISGDKGWSFESKFRLPAYTVDAGVMTQLMLSYLAAGYKGFGMWCWSPRTVGLEGGEYSLLDRNLQPGERAVRAGQIGQAAVRLRDEIWQAHKEPLVGVLFDQENDMQYAVLAESGRDIFVDFPMQARVGASRALINGNIPWEYVTAKNLRQGLAGRYRVIYLPAMLAVSNDIFEILMDYVHRGGRVVADMPSFTFDEVARVIPTGRGSRFEALFGVTLDDFQYASNVPRRLQGQALSGFVIDATVTRAHVLDVYDSGRPAVTEATCGRGSAVLLGYEAALMCFKPGNTAGEARLVRYALGAIQPPYRCEGALVYRIAAPQADHYFLINDGPATTVVLETGAYAYRSVSDPVAQQPLDLGAPVSLEAYSGRWLRFEKA